MKHSTDYSLSSLDKERGSLKESMFRFDPEDWENRDPDRIIAKRIEHIADNFDMNRSRFADKVDLSESYLSNIMNGRRRPTQTAIKKICRKAGVNYKWILTGKGPALMEAPEDIFELLSKTVKIELEDEMFLKFFFSMPYRDRLVFYKFIKTM